MSFPVSPSLISPQVAETMARLSSKPGVLATMAIDRPSSTILATSGNSSLFTSIAATMSAGATTTGFPSSSPRSAPAPSASPSATSASSEFALMIWKHVQSTLQVIHAMDTDDDLRLLRIRTKRQELLIVPDPKYIFVVINEVPGS